MDKETRRNCRYCRFQSCLRSGMKITWVLSDEERDRRFNKLKKSRKNIINSVSIQTKPSVARPSVLYLAFSTEEQKFIEDLTLKFQVPWLENLLIFVDLIKYAFGREELKFEHWGTFKTSMRLNFIRYILPRFPELEDLSSHDISQIMNSQAAGIAQFFRSCHMFRTGSILERTSEHCPVSCS